MGNDLMMMMMKSAAWLVFEFFISSITPVRFDLLRDTMGIESQFFVPFPNRFFLNF